MTARMYNCFAGALLADRLAAKGVGTAILEAGAEVTRGHAFATYLSAAVKTPESPYGRTALWGLSRPLVHIWHREHTRRRISTPQISSAD